MNKTSFLFVGMMFGILSLLCAETHRVYETMARNPGRFASCMQDKGWDDSGNCSAQTDECDNCYGCCGDGYVCNGSGSDLARAEWQTCLDYCGIDLMDCDPAPDDPPGGGGGQHDGSGGASS